MRQGQYWLCFKVFKTSDGSIGNPVTIPIPAVAYLALTCLERLTETARQVGNTKSLLISATNNFGKRITHNGINQFLDRWCEDLGLEESIHPHQFRKTLAMFAIFQDSRNVGILKYLFSHDSYLTTLAYIVTFPGLRKEMKAVILQENMELLTEVAAAVASGAVGGLAGQRLKKAYGEERKYAATLNNLESLQQYVDSLMDEGLTLLHRTQFQAICLKKPELEQGKGAKSLNLHPNVAHCEPLHCKNAVFTPKSEIDLQQELKFYQKLVAHPYCRDEFKPHYTEIIKQCETRLAEIGCLTRANDSSASVNSSWIAKTDGAQTSQS